MNVTELYNYALSELHRQNSSPLGFTEFVCPDRDIKITYACDTVVGRQSGNIIFVLMLIGHLRGYPQDSRIIHGDANSCMEFNASSTGMVNYIHQLQPALANTSSTFTHHQWNMDDINEEFIFQQSTIMNVPPYSQIEKILKYEKSIHYLCKLNTTCFLLNMELDWDNVVLTPKDFQ